MNNYLDVENLIKSRRDTKNFLSKKISKKRNYFSKLNGIFYLNNSLKNNFFLNSIVRVQFSKLILLLESVELQT